MLKRFLKNQRGLTLVELLAVIVILGIIAAIAVPSIGGIVAKTEKEALKADAVQVVNAAKLYTAENIRKINTDKDNTIVLTKGKKNNDEGELDVYLDTAPEVYSVTITKDTANNKFTYTNIEVEKNGEKAEFDTEADLHEKE
ncbi:type IV pilus assembly protein PilA [Bacillus fengqiuensis]|nr:type IV pilus assembly protein PilA [Bacillus fengqiuensis]